jgi:ATP-dependent DNA helicase RecQ
VYVRTRRNTIELSNFLNYQSISATYYHGGLSKKEKDNRLEDWLGDKVQVIVATNAFGMGIDKPDVEVVVHYQIPDSIENYFQESGRAGRNGEPAKAILITNNADENQVKGQFLSGLPTVAFLRQLYNRLNNYFQISYGEISPEVYSLNFNTFCDTYKLNPYITYNGLRMLDQNSVLSLSESFSKKTSIQFIATKNQIFDYLETYTKSAAIIQTILRTYGGIFEYDTKINTWSIAKKVNLPENVITKTLEQLAKDQIINYSAQSNDIEIVFLVPREDDSTINMFAKKVDALITQKTKNIDTMLAYLKNDTVCRNQYLLNYFGEKREKCGQCDVCLKAVPLHVSVIELAKEAILQQLKMSPQSSRKLIIEVLYKEDVIFNALQELLEDEIITLNTTNQYKIVK